MILKVLEDEPRTAIQLGAVLIFAFFMLYKLGRILKAMRELGDPNIMQKNSAADSSACAVKK